MLPLENLRHSTAHLLAAAVLELYPKTKRTIGPAIEDGFYYDFDFGDIKISELDLPKIEKQMKKIIQGWKTFEKQEVTKEEAKKQFKDNPYKIELIEEFSKENKNLTFYKSGNYIDLCKGGHIEHPSKELQHFKLLKVTGAYWRGDSDKKMLTRIYGTVFPTKEQLNEYLELLQEAKKRDHRTLGKQLDLFSFHEESPGAPFFHPRGTVIYNELLNFIKEQYLKQGYQEVITPLLYDKSLWETSGHWEHYKENMFTLKIDNKEFSLKPMNCPSHILIYKSKTRSYKDLPIRIADFAPLHRNELRGVLAGLTRVRKFSQDDSHTFVSEELLEKELTSLINFIELIYKKTFKMEYRLELGTRPEKFLGEKKLWDKAENILEKILKQNKLKYELNKGEGAFYGPKIDIHVKDALKRSHQCATIQIDFQLPLRFEANYEGADGKKHTPIMIHKAILGSLERFIGILLEHTAGKLPVWLSPTQVSIITVSDRHTKFSNKLANELRENGIRVEVDTRAESISKKVRDHQQMKSPYILTIGDKELKSTKLAVRTKDNKIINLSKKSFLKKITGEIKERKC